MSDRDELRAVAAQADAWGEGVPEMIFEKARLAEREAIIALLESLKTEWRPTPGGFRKLPEETFCKVSTVQGSGSHLRIPATVPTVDEVAMLDRAIAKIRARK